MAKIKIQINFNYNKTDFTLLKIKEDGHILDLCKR